MKDALRSFHVFSVAASSENFSKAARRLDMTPASVSRTIAQLEASVGARLFNRNTVSVKLTAEGVALRSAIGDRLDELLADVADMLSGLGHNTGGPLKVSLTNAYGKSHVLPKLPLFLAKYPDITLEIAFNDHRGDLLIEGHDIGTCYGPPDENAYISRVVCRPKLVLVASPGYLSKMGVPRSLDELTEHDCIEAKPDGVRSVAWLLKPPGNGTAISVAPRARLKISDQIDGVLLAAVAGLGITLVHRQAAEPFLRRGELRALLVDHAIESESGSEVYAYFPHRSGMASRARAFVEFLANEVGDEEVDIIPFAA
ncbi:LysR family transcriptional regulator [Novosphingobium sp. G106]|uniref:LysR family transcriptional regulator n=1 Tax=Novosphingobium sp. G106 TaxID=2849500 RepID=UPI001C2D4C83|nr:LysR family transcriptional regulator [Novosphingobium sp. G106]MBV1688977.1 LysR family transcriptional regulator [Novosphingobium sp. G106]